MNLTSDFAGNNQLRVFVGAESTNEPAEHLASEHLDSQLPFIQDLFQRFESVTGWTLAFHESRKSQVERGSDSQATIFGEIEIDDMSSLLEAGKSARHRGYCDQLVETLDCMVHIIQSDRQRFRNIDQHLSPVVDLPFDWWGIAGNAGYQHGSFASWSVTSQEKVRVFAGQVLADDMQSSMLSSATLLSLFETASQTSIALEKIAPLVASVKERSSIFDAKLNWFTTVELDPVTGEYELDGYDCHTGVALIDTQAGAVLKVGPDELEGVLYSGQILAIGLTPVHVARIQELTAVEGSTIEQITNDFQREFSQDAILFLYRK